MNFQSKLLLGLAMSTTFSMAAFTNINCDNDSGTLGIPVVECKALEALWDSTDGANWTKNDGWDTNTSADTWTGITLNNGSVYRINFEDNVADNVGNNLIGTIPSQLGDLSNLFELNLARNKFTGSIPSELGNLSKLSFLKIN